jgi:hypothetical protein
LSIIFLILAFNLNYCIVLYEGDVILRILVFDDDEDFLGRITARFKTEKIPNLDLRCIWCTRACKAERLVQEINPDILFADHMLSKSENGFAAAQSAAESGIQVFTTTGGREAIIAMYAGIGISHVPKSMVAHKIMELASA